MAARIELSSDKNLGPLDSDKKKDPGSDLLSKVTDAEGKAAGADLHGGLPGQMAPLLNPKKKDDDKDSPDKPHRPSPLKNFDD